MIRVLLVDDEAPARRKLARLIAEAADFTVVAQAASGPEAVEAISAQRPDLVFLDIRMPGLDGFEVIAAVGPDAMPPVVFVTAYDDHAVEAFEVEALDYLLKPVSPERFAQLLARVRRRLGARGATPAGAQPGEPAAGGAGAGEIAVAAQRDWAARLEAVLARLDERPRPLTRILVRREERSFLLPVAEVDLFEADGNYVKVHARGAVFRLRGRFGALAARLDPERFLRLGRSQVVRLEAIREIQPWFHGDQRVLLKDGRALLWSRRFRGRGEVDFEV